MIKWSFSFNIFSIRNHRTALHNSASNGSLWMNGSHNQERRKWEATFIQPHQPRIKYTLHPRKAGPLPPKWMLHPNSLSLSREKMHLWTPTDLFPCKYIVRWSVRGGPWFQEKGGIPAVSMDRGVNIRSRPPTTQSNDDRIAVRGSHFSGTCI